MPQTRRIFLKGMAAFAGAAPLAVQAQGKRKTRNVLLVMTDGLRRQEIFGGADAALMNQQSGVPDVEGLKKRYWRETPAERREALMPFLWTVIGRKGQIFGNRGLGSDAYVTNEMNFSYPGYNETLSGYPDSRIDSNDKNLNPNVTVLEWLHHKPAYRGKVAAFGAWDVFPYILNVPRSGLLVNAGYDPFSVAPVTERVALLNQLKKEAAVWEDEPLDVFAFRTALEYVKQHSPRILFLSLGETDEWAHAGNYATYLQSANRVDQYLKELWNTVQGMPQYRGTTSLIFSPDHGRGEAPVEWKSHGKKVPDSKYIWMAFLGPDTPALGERSKVEAVTQSQIAATLASLLGEDYCAEVAKAGKPIRGVADDGKRN
jgi:hypothetical protein